MFPNYVLLERIMKDKQAEIDELIKRSEAGGWEQHPGDVRAWRRLLLIAALVVFLAGAYALGLV